MTMKKKDVSEENNENRKKKNPQDRFKDGSRPIGWDKLDNTANIFPVVAGEELTNVYRISVTLTEEIKPDILQEALDTLLPKYGPFNLRPRVFYPKPSAPAVTFGKTGTTAICSV